MCVADYKILEKMNRSVEEKYKNLSSVSGNINIEMEKLNEKYVNLLPLLSQIDEVELCVTELEASAGKLDVYSKKLETKFKQFIEKNNSK
jgi:biogenesis of lysosome-related organelles complex 1 subunit 2